MAHNVRYEKNAKDEWNFRTSKINVDDRYDIPFSEIFEKYLPRNKKLSVLEVGSIPGNFLVYFNKNFGYQVNGIDFADNDQVFHETMRKNGIDDYKFTKGDFFEFNPPTKYDLVASFGFIEHFDNIADIVKRHVNLVKPGGYLILTVPNFRFLQYLYHYKYDKNNLDIHNLDAMKIGSLKKILRKFQMTKVYAGYFGNLQVWRQETEVSLKQQRQLNSIHSWISKHGKKFPTSRLYSPYIVLIYRKPNLK